MQHLVRIRNLVGKVGWRFLLFLAIPIHVATVIVAFRWYGGGGGAVAATVSAIIPVVPEVVWAVRVAFRDGVAHWYVLSVAAYPALWMLFLLGGMAFAPRE